MTEALAQLEQAVHAALETYSNVHRGSGQASLVSTHLYEQAREIVLESLGLNKDRYVVIFCSPRRAELLRSQLRPKSYRMVSSQEIGLSLGVRALAVQRKALPKGIPFQSGGGTARLVAPSWVIWANAPDRFEAGTPAIVTIIAFARALQLIRQFGKEAFQPASAGKSTAAEILYRDELEKFSGQALLNELRKTLIGRDVRVPTLEGPRPYTNLDNGASTPTFEPIWEAVRQTWRQSVQVQQEIIQEVEAICAEALGASQAQHDLIFTSNTTEAINLAAESLGKEAGQGTETVVLNTLLEHNSNELPWRRIPGVSVLRLPVDPEGFVDLHELEAILRGYNQEGLYGKKRIRLMAVSGASNVLGTFNDLAEISRIAHRYGARLLVDAAQMAAHRKVDVEGTGIDYLAFSAHKVYAPFGCGVLVARKGLLRIPAAELEQIRSSGEENAGGIAALGKALVLLRRIGLDVIQAEEQALTGQALSGMAQIPGLTVYGVKDPGSPRFAQKGGVIAFGMQDKMPGKVAKELAERGGIGVRTGCFCAHMLVKRLVNVSPQLEQIQRMIFTPFHHLTPPGLSRVSLGIENRAEDVENLIQVLKEIAQLPPAGVGNPFARKDGQPKTEIEQSMLAFVQAAAERVYA